MPELPEVEVVRRGLLSLVGATVEAVEVLDDRAITRHQAGAADFEARLTGTVLGAPARRGKFLWVPLGRDVPRLGPAGPSARPGLPRQAAEGDAPSHVEAPDGHVPPPQEALLVHLGMSGQLRIDDEWRPHRHERVRVELPGRTLVFIDQRTFGSLAVDPLVGPAGATPSVPSQVAHIALDPLDPAFDLPAVAGRMRTRRTELKRALLDQTLVSGIGNIYADEALWGARLHPRQPTAALPVRVARRVLREAQLVMERALAEGGTSFDALYVNVNGESGYFSRSLQVYGRAGWPCPRCGRALVRESFTNRSSHFCPRCQRIR